MPRPVPNYYEQLQISQTDSSKQITDKQITAAYNELKSGNKKKAPGVTMEEIDFAYSVLKDPKIRAGYDKDLFPYIDSLYEVVGVQHWVVFDDNEQRVSGEIDAAYEDTLEKIQTEKQVYKQEYKELAGTIDRCRVELVELQQKPSKGDTLSPFTSSDIQVLTQQLQEKESKLKIMPNKLAAIEKRETEVKKAYTVLSDPTGRAKYKAERWKISTPAVEPSAPASKGKLEILKSGVKSMFFGGKKEKPKSSQKSEQQTTVPSQKR